ncbi:putative secreted effector protein [Blumeria graminis f. sp. tritici 96224]|uniref:Putative secreted effector protein n=1 Tax=Blumeria graminis f. sp. tritici 96224 TaxID=1268274 RepID=A0A656KPH0_BLUGR|nr:putative secreted effector protein [Blumeria graminis f. sp. tritici 96224]
MRLFTIGLTLQSVSLPIAVLASFKTPHVAEENKMFDCDYKTFDPTTLMDQISVINYYGGINRLQQIQSQELDALYMGQWGNAKAMYHDGSTVTHYLYEMHGNQDCTDINKYKYTLVVDNKDRACAVLERIIPLNSDIGDFEDGYTGSSIAESKLCAIR